GNQLARLGLPRPRDHLLPRRGRRRRVAPLQHLHPGPAQQREGHEVAQRLAVTHAAPPTLVRREDRSSEEPVRTTRTPPTHEPCHWTSGSVTRDTHSSPPTAPLHAA